MKNSMPRILLLGDYSNCHVALAGGLRKLGCDVTVASDGSSWMQTGRDINLARHDGLLGGLLHTANIYRLIADGHLRGFDIVAFNDPNALHLKPSRLRYFFDKIRRANGRVFYTAMSTDILYLDMLERRDSPLRYSEWFVDGKPSRWHIARSEAWKSWHAPALVDYQRYFFDNIDGAVSILYEYDLGMRLGLGADRCAYAGIPIDIDGRRFRPIDLSRDGKVRLFLGRDRNRSLMKGSDYLTTAAGTVAQRHPADCEFILVENRPFDEFRRLLESAHVVLDQIYSYTPATTALMAMADGHVVVSGAEPEYYDFIGETDNRPIVNAPIDLDELTETIDSLVVNARSLPDLGNRSRLFVERHNDALIVARRFLDFWTSRL